MVFTCAGSVMAPTAIVAILGTLRIASANWTWNMRPYTGFWSATVCPADTSTRSQPASRNASAIANVSSSLMPPSFQSVAEMRTDIGRCAGQAARIARKTSSG